MATMTITPAQYFGTGVNVAMLPAGMRNNNPGNIKFTSLNAFPGVIGPSENTDQGDPQAVFTSPLAGMEATANLILKKYRGGKTTINDLIAGNMGWTPGNFQAAANIAKTAGFKPDQALDMSDPAVLKKVMRGLVTQEHGSSSKLYPDDLISKAVGSVLGDSHVPETASVVTAPTNQLTASAFPYGGLTPPTASASPSTPEIPANNLMALSLIGNLMNRPQQPMQMPPMQVQMPVSPISGNQLAQIIRPYRPQFVTSGNALIPSFG